MSTSVHPDCVNDCVSSDDDDMPGLMDNNDDDFDDEPEGEGDGEGEDFLFPTEEPTKDLFSEKVFPSVQEALKEAKDKHGVCIKSITARLQLDTLGFIRLVNWVRATKPSAGEVNAIKVEEVKEKFGGDEWMKPVRLESRFNYLYEKCSFPGLG